MATYLAHNWHKFAFVLALFVGYGVGSALYFQDTQVAKTEAALTALNDSKAAAAVRSDHYTTHAVYSGGWLAIAFAGFLIFARDIRRTFTPRRTALTAMLAWSMFGIGCYRPFQPVKLEVIAPNEEAFMLPYTGDAKKQTSSDNEEYLKANLVYTKQVQIPQQWVQHGYEWLGVPNGNWRDAAIVIKVDKSPVTREWTADPMSGTSNKNEAIWVMTADQVEFSTGWTITARIDSRDNAIKFLHNYPNGTLTKVLDTEVRSKLQAEFGLEVTDLPMETLRKAATPHLLKVTDRVTKFFAERGITITNLGISGGFVYKDKSILDTMVRVFNSEQEKSVAMAETAAQEERNKKVIFEATGKADALLKTKKAEADSIKMIADAKFYELEKARENLGSYVQLKHIELQKDLLGKWDGRYPLYFIGGGQGSHPNMLMQLPPLDSKVQPKP